jgi:hypothetical protein
VAKKPVNVRTIDTNIGTTKLHLSIRPSGKNLAVAMVVFMIEILVL